MKNAKVLLKNLFFVLFVPGIVAGWLPWFIGSHSAGETGWWHWPGLLLLIVGGSIVLLCVWDFAMQGRGTPFPLAPTEYLVTNRLYQYSRNPMYVGVLTVLAGWILWFSSWPTMLYALAVAAAVSLFVIFVEEPMLERQFGSSYEAYCRRVPRWI